MQVLAGQELPDEEPYLEELALYFSSPMIIGSSALLWLGIYLVLTSVFA